MFLKEHHIESYIKLQDHEQRKTRAYKENIGKYYNMRIQVFEDEHYYICYDGRELRYIRTEEQEKDSDKNKVMKINERWEKLKEKSHANIQSEKEILNRLIRSIQTEGHFGDIKENNDFRRFNHRSADKVYKEFMLYAIGRNINKYPRFLCNRLRKFEGKKEEKIT